MGLDGFIGNAVSTNCIIGYSIIANYKAVDNAGNEAKVQAVYDFPKGANGTCYPIGM